MKTHMGILLALFLGLAFTGRAADAALDKKAEKAVKTEKKKKKNKKPDLRHVVAFKFKDTASKEDIQKLIAAFSALPGKIPEIAKFEHGLNNSPEGLNKGCTHGWILTFRTEKDRDAYLIHPDHKEFGKMVGPLVSDVFVFDFWAKD